MIRLIREIRRVPMLLAVACLASACGGQSLASPTLAPAAVTPSQISRRATTVPTGVTAATATQVRTVSLPDPSPTRSAGMATPPAGVLTVSLADAGTTITLQTGDTFMLSLGTDYDWKVSVEDASIVSAMPNIVLARDAQGIYKANQAGTTTLSATGTPVCPPDKMCIAMVKEFQVQIVVQ